MKTIKRLAAAACIFLLTRAAPTAHAQLPTPDYSGDFLTRSTLTGDWGGLRNELARQGFTIALSVTQVYQGVIGGGRDMSWNYGGRGDLLLNLDTGKAGLWQGGFFTVE